MKNINENNWQIIFEGDKELKITILDDGNLLINIDNEVYVSKTNYETNIKNLKKELE